jgi:predicted nucleic acid-binding protein
LTAFVDVNIPVFAFGREHPYRAPCQAILFLAETRRNALVCDVEALQELLNLYMRREGLDWARRAILQFRTALHDSFALVTLADIDAAVAHDLPARLAARDRIHVAVMRRLGVTQMVTADRGFEGVPGIQRLDPLLLPAWRDEVFAPG